MKPAGLVVHEEALHYRVWPSLAVIGGVDTGLRIGGACVDRDTSKRGTVLGVSKEGNRSVKVQWDEGDSIAR